MSHPRPEHARALTRRALLGSGGLGLGSLALQTLLGDSASAQGTTHTGPHFAPRAKRIIYLHMAGSPSQLDLFDPKPALAAHDREPVPEDLIQGERFAFIKGVPKLLASPYGFAKHGESGQELSELLPHLAGVADDIAIVRSMHTTQFNHAPGQLFLNTGFERVGRPSMGSWLSYGLGSENQDLPAFVVMLSGAYGPSGGHSLWNSGFLPTVHQGVRFQSQGDPVLFLSNPEGMQPGSRRRVLDALRSLNEARLLELGDPEIQTRIAQYELAYRMQTSVPELVEIEKEPQEVRELYGAQAGSASFANNCLLARRLVERGVRFVQLYHWGWDSHGTSPSDDIVTSLPQRCEETDRACAALLKDLKRLGLLEDTLVVWGGEFGRTPMNEERNGSTYLGRDHHPHAFTMWLAGGGVRPGITLGATDELGYSVTEDPVSVHDLHATLLHLLGLDHERLTYRSQGRDFRLTDVYGKVAQKLLA
ncbi:MAG: sulfatase [Planctomycetes bacterium]|jgi:hypothetical protein|nr:sulfatase [Planctomycetota bacterium]